jgi:HEAT repeat protein
MTTPDVPNLARAVDRFRAWADAHPARGGEWEVDYPAWGELHAAAAATLAEPALTDADAERLLYALARDNECEIVLAALGDHPHHGLALARAALVPGSADADARWQLAVFLGTQADEESRALLARYVDDEDEYVRRRALLAAVLHDPSLAESVALARVRDPFEYARLAALSVLEEVASPALDASAARLVDDPSPYVRREARRILGLPPADDAR